MARIMTIGEILVEIMAIERGQSFRAPGALMGPFPSGAPAIFIDQVGRLGHSAGIIGCVGDDDFGWLNIDRLRRDGVDTSAIALLPDAVTGSAFVTYTETGERHFIFNIANSASGRLTASSVTEPVLADCSWLHVMGSSLFSPGITEAVHKAIVLVKRRGGIISFDPNIRPEILRGGGMRESLQSVLQQTDVFLPSGDEVALLIDAATEAEAIKQLLALGIREIVVKHGRAGCTYYDRSSRLDVPAFAVRELDPTGAGDCFCATYAACREEGKAIHQALRYACASGAIAVTRKGPMEGTATFAELDTLIGL
ncbi:MAG TPA: sugar kinase [Acidobacteriaceae bacterium]|nr:sugar kinase [Acidobacteriaceae bacterium]